MAFTLTNAIKSNLGEKVKRGKCSFVSRYMASFRNFLLYPISNVSCYRLIDKKAIYQNEMRNICKV